MATKVITAPTYEPISVADVAEYLRVDNVNADQSLISALITAARQYLEQYLNRPIAMQTLEEALTGWANPIVLDSSLQSVTTIKYLDVNGAEQTLAANQYLVDTYAEPAQITPAYNVTFPDLYAVPNNIKVRYVAGYTSGSSPNTNPLPNPLRFAMMLVIGDLYANREAAVTGTTYTVNPTVQNLLQFYRLNMGV
jgi:uncharacterized phiE125 gp8 family phage protein